MTLEERIEELEGERAYLWKDAQIARMLYEFPIHWRLYKECVPPHDWIAISTWRRIQHSDLFEVLTELAWLMARPDIPSIPYFGERSEMSAYQREQKALEKSGK